MVYLLLGSSSFLFFILYDLNNLYHFNKLLKFFFLVGCLVLSFSTLQLAILGSPSFQFTLLPKTLIAAGALVSIGLLFYTLFFALGWKETYVKDKDEPKLVYTGIYALCRHPGVLWFGAFYGLVWLFTGQQGLFYGFLLFTTLNVVYVMIQDHYLFPKLFSEYIGYKSKTPFLLPTPTSVRECLNTIKPREVKQDEF